MIEHIRTSEGLTSREYIEALVTSISFLNACPANFLNAFSMMSINKNRQTNVEATVAQKSNQGTAKGTGCYRSFLEGLWLLSFHQGKESDNIAK